MLSVATPLWSKCEDETHTPESGNLEPSGTPTISQLDCRGQNTSPWGVFYIVEKVLKCRCPKWPCMSGLDICSTSYGQKKGQESNWQFDSRPQKVGNRPDPGVCRWSATNHDLVPIGGRYEKLWTPKVPKVQTGIVSKLHFGSPEKKSHSGVGAVEQRREYYMGEGGGLPPSPGRGESSESKVAHGLSQHQKGCRMSSNQLVVGFGCRTE
jgi:hypothetical protein